MLIVTVIIYRVTVKRMRAEIAKRSAAGAGDDVGLVHRTPVMICN
jgi:hypothetical protein